MLERNQEIASPYFSIIIPAYNASQYIDFALKSVFNQTFQDYEVVVVDDGSTDDTYQVLSQINDRRLRIIRQENGGECAARNKGIIEAQGKYLAFLDADDAWMDMHLEIAANFFKKYPEYVWYLSDTLRVEDISISQLKFSNDGVIVYNAVNWFLEVAKIPMSSSCVLLKDAIMEKELFPSGVKMYGDNIGWSRFAMKYPMIGYFNCATAYYRIWGGAATDRFSVTRFRRSGVELDALLKHQQMAVMSDCSKEAKLFFKFFSYYNWWSRIRSLSLISWIDEMKQRKPVSGKYLTYWLIFFAYASDIFFRIMGKAVRIKYNRICRKMRKLAEQQRIQLG